jgi:hypothetical protein
MPTGAGESKVAGICAFAAAFIIMMILFFLGFLTDGSDESNEGGGAAPCPEQPASILALPIPGLDMPVVGSVLGGLRDVVGLAVPGSRPAEVCVATVTNGDGAGSSQPREVTPQDGWSVGAGSEQQLPHDEVASVVPTGQGPGGVGNSLNPQAPSTTPSTAAHAPTETPPPPPPPCDPQDPHSPCYEPPCDTSDPHGPCYEPPPYQPGDECDPDSPYYDPHAICL